MRVFFDGGVAVVGRRFRMLIDPFKPFEPSAFDAVLVTHGHSDHVTRRVKRAKLVLATPETLAVIGLRFGARPRRYEVVRPGDAVDLGFARVHALNAGHVPGSLMFVIEADGMTLGVTGDFNTAGSNVVPPAEAPEADVLVMEATYGSRGYVFPPRGRLYSQLLSLAEEGDRAVALLVGPLGKGQELATLFSGKRIYVHPRIMELNAALGVRGGKEYRAGVEPASGEAVLMPLDARPPPGAAVVALSGRFADGEVRRAAAARGVLGLPLSDHADFPGLIELALRSRARRIYTVYGHAEELAKWLNRLGVRASVIPPRGQTEITDWL